MIMAASAVAVIILDLPSVLWWRRLPDERALSTFLVHRYNATQL
jgi:hypothetical protein